MWCQAILVIRPDDDNRQVPAHVGGEDWVIFCDLKTSENFLFNATEIGKTDRYARDRVPYLDNLVGSHSNAGKLHNHVGYNATS